jgi:hypothetical protein
MLLNSYKDLIEKLVNQEYSPLLDNFYISIYLDVSKSNRSDIQTMVNSYINQSFDRLDELEDSDQLKQNVEKKIRTQLRGVTGFEEGLAIFAGFKKGSNDIEVNIANLNLKAKNDLFVGRVYNLDQLLWTYHHNRELLIIDLDKFNFDIYYLAGDKLEKIKGYKNEFFETKEKEYQEQFTPVEGASKIVYGKGKRKTERKKEQTLTHFFDWAFNNLLDEEFFQDFDLKHILIFHTSEYDEIATEIKEQVDTKLKLTPMMRTRINTESVNIREFIIDEVNKAKKKNKRELIKALKSEPKIFVQGWKEVTDAARLAKVSTLFLHPGLTKKGYLSRPDMIYTYPVKGSMKIKNISPWLVMNVSNKGGDIKIVDSTESLLKNDVSAKLRY